MQGYRSSMEGSSAAQGSSITSPEIKISVAKDGTAFVFVWSRNALKYVGINCRCFVCVSCSSTRVLSFPLLFSFCMVELRMERICSFSFLLTENQTEQLHHLERWFSDPLEGCSSSWFPGALDAHWRLEKVFTSSNDTWTCTKQTLCFCIHVNALNTIDLNCAGRWLIQHQVCGNCNNTMESSCFCGVKWKNGALAEPAVCATVSGRTAMKWQQSPDTYPCPLLQDVWPLDKVVTPVHFENPTMLGFFIPNKCSCTFVPSPLSWERSISHGASIHPLDENIQQIEKLNSFGLTRGKQCEYNWPNWRVTE